MMQQIANFIVDHDPMMVLRRTHDTVRYIRWEWNKDHADPIDAEELRLFLCDEHHGNLTDEQKVVACRCRDEMRCGAVRALAAKCDHDGAWHGAGQRYLPQRVLPGRG